MYRDIVCTVFKHSEATRKIGNKKLHLNNKILNIAGIAKYVFI